MVSSKAEFIPGGEAPAPTLLSGSGGLTVSSPVPATRPEAQTRKSNRSRTSAFLSNTILRPRGKSVSNVLVNDWGRPVGGSEGLGSIYNSAMDSRERSQVLHSVTTLTKDSDNDVTGAAAEAFSGNATPSTATRSRFFANFRADSSSNDVSGQTEAPPSYQTDHRPEPRRGSEGSVVSHISLPRHESASRSSISQPSSSRRASSYFSSAASSSLSSSATSSGSTSVAASPGPSSVLGRQPQQQQSQSQRRSSSQFSAAARQAFRSSRSFLGLPNGIFEDDCDAIHSQSSNGSSDSADNNNTATSTEAPTKAKTSSEHHSQMQFSSNSGVASDDLKAAASNSRVVDDDQEDHISSSPSRSVSDSRSHLHHAGAGAVAGGGETVTATNKTGKATATAERQLAAEAGHDADADASDAASAASLASKFEIGNSRPIGNAKLTNRREAGISGAAAEEQQKQKEAKTLILNSSKSEPTPSRVQEIPADLTPASGGSASAGVLQKRDLNAPAAAAETHQKQHDALSCFSDSASGAALPAAAASFGASDDSSVCLSHAQCLSQQSLDLGPVLPRSHSQAAEAEPESLQLQHALSSSSTAMAAPASTPLSSSALSPVPPPAPSSSAQLTSPPVFSSCTSSSPPSVPGTDVASVLLAPITSSSTSSSTTNVTTTASIANTTTNTTAATTPSQSTSKLAHVPTPSSTQPLTQPQSAASPSTASANPQHDLSSHSNLSLNSSGQSSQAQPKSILPSPVSQPQPSSSTAREPSSTHRDSGNDRRSLPLTPPGSSGPCLSPRTSVSGARDPRTGLPSPASSAHGSVSGPASRRGSSTEPTGILVNGLLSSATGPSPRTSVAFTDDVGSRPSFQAATSPPSSTGRVSFDLRRISLFGGSSAASKMSSNTGTRASFADIGNGLPPNAVDTNGTRQTSSPSGSTSKFFSRISLPGSSRRGSAIDASPLSSPESKPRSRFASFGRLGGRGNDATTSSPNGHRGLRNSMQPWASASTDVLGIGPGAAAGRNSLALAREEATRPRKSLHLPRTNPIDLDIEDNSDTTATTSSTTHRMESQALPPIAAATISKPEKPASPLLNSARRPSFNFLRRASATSTNSNADNVNGERRGSRGSTNSFARTFMNRTLSRNSKTSDTPADSARGIPAPNGESASPIFRNGIFDSQSTATPGTVAYPGMSSTVNWNATDNAPSSSLAEVAPGEVDPTVAIPPYPGSAASAAVPTQPKTVADFASGVLAERRPSHGIDQEQDAVEASDIVPDSLVPNATPTTAATTTPTPDQSSDSNVSRQRPTRSSNALSHLPRLNSMRTVAGTASSSQGNSNGVRERRTGSESTTDGTTAGETSEEEEEASEDEDESDLTGQTSDYHDLDTETDDETDDDPSPAVSRRMSAAPMAATGSPGGLNRNRPTESLILPPAPSFIPNPSRSVAEQDAGASPSTANAPSTSNGLFSQTVGRDTWTSFTTNGFTPFETPTPSHGGGSVFSGPTPRARQEQSESSYFAVRPGTSNSNRATTAGTMSGDAPPPSPSIISRSRTPSSASMRTMRTPGSGTMTSGPVPNRSMPTPGGALPPLALHRQISAASGSTRSGPDRSRSPGLAAASSRPSTSGTLTPHQTPAGDRSGSREPSIDRPASERPSSPTTAPKASTRQLVGLDGMPASTAARPNFYQQKSKSLVDLLGPASRRLEIDTAAASRPIIIEPSAIEAQRTPMTPRPPSEAPAYSKKDGLTPINTSGTTAASIASPSLGRRRSMFEMRAEPPPYSIIHNRPEGPQVILPREEEGKEKLPTYCCGVHIEGYLPRKMEFSAPGVQAKDRSWKRQYFVLHGTSLRVYKSDLSVDRHAANGSWGEMMGVHVHLEPMNEDGSNGSGSGIGLGAAAREAISHTPLGNHRHEASKNKEGSTQFDAKNGLIRNYTLQGAESGLAADYLKRRHVVRVRAEGEQFLLQTRSDRHVVDWIEALQAATNVAMDLEKRPMPKFITLPHRRRRRRRRRNADGTVISPEEQERRGLAEAQRRSIAEAGGRLNVGTSGAEATPRESMSQPGRASMSLENELNPSAAFERMLREDQEEGGRQSAAVM